MNASYVTYATKLFHLGDKIINISNTLLGLNSSEDKEDKVRIENKYNICLKAINDYKECKSGLLDVIPPEKVKEAHGELIKAIQMFIDGTECMFKAINIKSIFIDKDMILKGFLIQKQGKEKVVEVTNQISKLLSE